MVKIVLTNSPENRVNIYKSSHAQRNASIKDRETQRRGGEPCILIADLEFAGKIGVWLEVASLKLTLVFQGAALAFSKGSSSRKEVVGVSKFTVAAVDACAIRP